MYSHSICLGATYLFVACVYLFALLFCSYISPYTCMHSQNQPSSLPVTSSNHLACTCHTSVFTCAKLLYLWPLLSAITSVAWLRCAPNAGVLMHSHAHKPLPCQHVLIYSPIQTRFQHLLLPSIQHSHC